MDYNKEFTIPFYIRWTPFKRCEECKKRKITTCLYEISDTGLIYYVEYYICRKCMKEAKARVK